MIWVCGAMGVYACRIFNSLLRLFGCCVGGVGGLLDSCVDCLIYCLSSGFVFLLLMVLEWWVGVGLGVIAGLLVRLLAGGCLF